MKNQRLIQSIWSLVLSTTIIVSGSFSFSALAHGGIGDGSGNIQDDNSTDGQEIVGWLKRSKAPTFYTLHALESILSQLAKGNFKGPAPAIDFKSIYRKLFQSKKTIYQALNEAVWDPIPKGSCESPGNPEEKDANSVRSWPRVCFSLERLSRIKEKFGKTQLLALIVHELSHVSGDNKNDGATEAEANVVQTLVQSQLSDTVLDNADSVAKDFMSNTQDLIQENKEMRDSSQESLSKFYCMQIMTSASQLAAIENQIGDSIPQLGIMVVPLKSLSSIFVALVKQANLVSVCDPDPARSAKRDEVFGGQTQISVQEYNRKSGFMTGVEMPAAIIRRIDNVNSPALRAELNDVIGLIESVRASAVFPPSK